MPSCAAYSGRAKARAIYLFPSWFISRAIDAAFYRGPFGDISANFRIVGVQQRNSPIFDAVAAGDIDMMQRLFSDGLARPNNIDHEGTTLIFAAVAYRRDHIVKFLLSAGADAHYPNRERISAFDRAWDGIITCRAIHDSSRNSMRDIFNDTRELDSWQLTRLHKIVLGLLPGDLKNELELTKQDINTPDSHERTPLFWAVAVADPAAVETLLEYGADPNITNCAGAPPLRKATAADRLDIFLLLLKHGANPNWKTVLGMQITHTVMSYHLDLQYLEASLNPGLDLNARGGYSGNTPLLIAVRANNTTKTRWLLEHDAEIDKKDKDGYTPLMIAAYRNYSDCVKILLEHGADWTLKVPYGGSIITLVAAYGVRETYNALAAFGAVRGVDLEAKVNYGKSAKDMVFLDGFDPGGKAAYLRLLNTEICERCMLDARSGISAGVSLGRYNFNSSNVHETDEVFHDAKDSQRPSHTHPEVPEGLLDEDLEGEEMVVDDDGRVFVRSLFWPEMWMLQQPGQDLVAQRRIAAMQIDKAIAEAHENEEQKVLAEAEEEEKQEG